MVKTTGRTVLVTGRTVLIAGSWSDAGTHPAFPDFLSDADSVRPGLGAAVEHLEHLPLGVPASTRPPAPTAMDPFPRSHP